MAEDLIDALWDTGLCKRLTRDEVGRLAAAGRVERWSAGAVVMEEGTEGPRLIVLLEGRVVVEKRDEHGGEHLIGEVGPGDVLGEMSLLTGAPRTATVRAVTPLRVFAIDRHTFEGMVEDRDPAALHLGLCVARSLAERLESLNHRVVELLESEDQLRSSPAADAVRDALLRRIEA